MRLCVRVCVCSMYVCVCLCITVSVHVAKKPQKVQKTTASPYLLTDRHSGGLVHVLAPHPGRDGTVPPSGQQVAFVIQHGQHRTLHTGHRLYREVAAADIVPKHSSQQLTAWAGLYSNNNNNNNDNNNNVYLEHLTRTALKRLHIL